MKRIFPLIATLLMFTFVTSCEKNDGDETPVYIEADWATVGQVTGGGHYLFKYTAIAVQGKLAKIIVKSYDPYDGLKELGTIELSGSKKTDEYDFLVPYFPEEVVEMELRMTVVNSDGEEWTGRKRLQVSNEDKVLTETTMNLVEIPAAGKYNGISFANGIAERINTEVSSDLSKQHVVIYRKSDLSDKTASKGILTKAENVRFARVNSFDYSGAKYNMLNKAFQDKYSSGQTVETVGNLVAGDIILVGQIDEGTKKASALGVLKVGFVPETNDKETDVYVFNVKSAPK